MFVSSPYPALPGAPSDPTLAPTSLPASPTGILFPPNERGTPYVVPHRVMIEEIRAILDQAIAERYKVVDWLGQTIAVVGTLAEADAICAKAPEENPYWVDRNWTSSQIITDVCNLVGACVVAGEHPGHVDATATVVAKELFTHATTTAVAQLPSLPSSPLALPLTGVTVGLPATAVVHLVDGGVCVPDLHPGDRLAGPGGGRVVLVLPHGTQRVVTIRHQFGELTVGADLPIAVFGGLDQWIMKPARLLAPGDRLVWDPSGYDGVATQMPAATFIRRAHNTTGWDVRIPTFDPEIAWLIGLFHGNGYAFVPPPHAKTPNGYVNIACPTTYPVNIERAVAAFQRFGVMPRIKAGDGNYVKVEVYANDLARYVQSWIKQPNTPIVIPPWIRNATRTVRAAYLAGVFDADGSAKTRPLQLVSSIYPDFVAALRRLYASLGIASERNLHRAARGNWQALYHLTTRGMENRAAFTELIAPWSGKARDLTPIDRAPGGFTFPTDLVRAAFAGHPSWVVPSDRQTTHRITQSTDHRFTAYPLAVEAVTVSITPEELFTVVIDGPAELVLEGVVVAGMPLGDLVAQVPLAA